MKLDVTGTADLQAQIDSIADLLNQGPVADGGLSWDADTRTVTVPVVGPVDGTSLEVEQVKASVLAAAEGSTVEFQSVRVLPGRAGRTELPAVLDHGPVGARSHRSGWRLECLHEPSRVVVPAEPAEAWAERLRALNDNRIVMQTYTGGIDTWFESL